MHVDRPADLELFDVLVRFSRVVLPAARRRPQLVGDLLAHDGFGEDFADREAILLGRRDLDEVECVAVDVGEDGRDGFGGLQPARFFVDDSDHVGLDFFIFGGPDRGFGGLGVIDYLAGFEDVGVAALVVGDERFRGREAAMEG